jgi:RNA recognition motif-containing protein
LFHISKPKAKMKTLTVLENKYNSSERQTKHLFKMCGNNIEKLDRLFFTMKENFVFNVPCDEEQVERVLAGMQPNKSFCTD